MKKDLTGQKFGWITVIDKVGQDDKHRHMLWAGQCGCGKYTIQRGSDLRTGRVKTCGCFNNFVKKPVVSYRGAHQRVYHKKGRAADYKCIDNCGKMAEEWSYNYGDPSALVADRGYYSLDPKYYEPRCKFDHKRFDLTHTQES